LKDIRISFIITVSSNSKIDLIVVLILIIGDSGSQNGVRRGKLYVRKEIVFLGSVGNGKLECFQSLHKWEAIIN
jgi:hypothetical protein